MNTNEVVCVIEDSVPIRKLFVTILKKSGLETVDFEDGKSSMEWLRNNKCKGVIMDLLLPDTNGSELLKDIRNLPEGRKIKVIAVTGFAKQTDREKYLSMGFDGYITKPVNTAAFPEEVKEILNK
ncbi:MAG: response regulator [Bacteroidota bacterium]